MTHCHSSAAEQILIQAQKENKDFQVICTETRPKFQGRITAKVLTEAGIQVTMVVDSAMRWVLKNKEVDSIIEYISTDVVMDSTKEIRLNSAANFESNSTIPIINKQLKDILSEIESESYDVISVEIFGFSDSSGEANYNINLSERRANVMKSYFITAGVEESLISVKGYGETRPIRENSTLSGKSLNRRVEVKIILSEFKI